MMATIMVKMQKKATPHAVANRAPCVLSPYTKLLKQRFGLLEVCRIESLGKPAIDIRQELTGCSQLALALPQADKAHHGS